ncbi:MAG: DegV family protein [Actinomycetia bacterium]|nr:DegV family protein [Actinomycetes bacterium]
MSVKIVTDSASDLPDHLLSELGIAIVPLTIRFGDEEFIDRVELQSEEFWRRCSSSEILPETAAPSPGAFETAYRAALSEGFDEVVTINLSGAMSATIQAADAAAKAVSDLIRVEIVDSRTVSMGLGSLVLQAAREARAGADAATIAAHIRDAAERTIVLAALDTLENLKKGGRIGGAASMLGSLLSIKPIIEVVDGKVESNSKQRTRAKALNFLLESVQNAGEIESLAVMHARCDDLDTFIARLREIHSGEIVVGDIGAVIGSHAGTGVMGVTYQVPA